MASAVVTDPAPLDAEPGPLAGDAADADNHAKPSAPEFLHSPPDSNDAAKTDATDSELSDLEDEPVLDGPPPAIALASAPPPPVPPGPPPSNYASDGAKPEVEEKAQDDDDIGEVLPDHWSGSVPVFRPTMHQFKDFQRFMKEVDRYGMKSGIIKIIPPPEWKDAQPPLDDLVKYVKVREPIKQDIMGSNGTYRQVNILHGRSYNVPQWRQLCEQSEHQPPARRGERRANADKPKPPRSRAPPAAKSSKPSTPKTRSKGRAAKGQSKTSSNDTKERPMTPVSPKEGPRDGRDEPVNSVETDAADVTERPATGRMDVAKQSKPKTQSVSARRKYSRREGSAMIDEAAFADFDYRMDISDYTPERCEELERAYWKTLTYASPLYGADLMGTLFDDRTDIWNLNKLPNLLDVLGTKVPGVNTAYLYLGMWKATFAWHLEDVDLYSINYLHFGAPKQWYSISQADARCFEAAMKNVWPADAKACNQFLRHKGFLISPHHLLSHYGIKVNKVVSYPGEFVVTYPYGYHSGYNLGYNCAEAVNFALDSWLPMGKIAKRCECAQAQDSVWINVYEIERKLRGEETEFEETEDEEDDDDDDDGEVSGLPTPPASHGVRFKDVGRKRKRGLPDKHEKVKVKKIKLRLKAKVDPPCCLCPHDVAGLEVLPTEDGRKAHRICALYVPETYVESVDGKEVIYNVAGISKGRFDLKCLFCRSKRGACFQCSRKKCTRAYHATCEAAAGVFVEEQDVPVLVDDGTEYKERAFGFSCRFHRVRRDKTADGAVLETDQRIRTAAQAVQKGEICQFQFHQGDIFAGLVVDNQPDEHMMLIDVLPRGDRVEVEWKWLLLPDPADFHLPKASAKAIPMPSSRKAQDQLNARRLRDDKPKKDDVFADGYTWAEFQLEPISNGDQCRIDLSKPDQLWFYLGKTSTDLRAQYTEDPTTPRYNPKGNFLDTLPKPAKPPPVLKSAAPRPRPPKAAAPARAQALPVSQVGAYTTGSGASTNPKMDWLMEKPYAYKPKARPGEPYIAPPTYVLQQQAPSVAQPSLPPTQGLSGQHPCDVPRAGYGTTIPSTTNQDLSNVTGVQARAQLPRPQQTGYPRPPAPAGPSHQKAASATLPGRSMWEVRSSVFHKYPFFQVNHNREPSKYQSPYASWSGFTNGYESNMRGLPTATQTGPLVRPSSGVNPSVPVAPAAPNPGSSNPLAHLFWRSEAAASMLQGTTRRQNAITLPPLVAPGVSTNTAATSYAPDSTARVAQGTMAPPPRGPWIQQRPIGAVPSPSPARTPSGTGGVNAAAATSAPPIKPVTQPRPHPKESPVPLPANFLAAMAAATSGGGAQARKPEQASASARPAAGAGPPAPVRPGMEQTRGAVQAPSQGPRPISQPGTVQATQQGPAQSVQQRPQQILQEPQRDTKQWQQQIPQPGLPQPPRHLPQHAVQNPQSQAQMMAPLPAPQHVHGPSTTAKFAPIQAPEAPILHSRAQSVSSTSLAPAEPSAKGMMSLSGPGSAFVTAHQIEGGTPNYQALPPWSPADERSNHDRLEFPCSSRSQFLENDGQTPMGG